MFDTFKSRVEKFTSWSVQFAGIAYRKNSIAHGDWNLFILVVMTGQSLVIGTGTGEGDEAAVEAGIARTVTGTAGGVAAAVERGGAAVAAGTESAAKIARAMTKVGVLRTITKS